MFGRVGDAQTDFLRSGCRTLMCFLSSKKRRTSQQLSAEKVESALEHPEGAAGAESRALFRLRTDVSANALWKCYNQNTKKKNWCIEPQAQV